MGDAWEWELADGSKISARLELPARIESVYLGKRLISRSAAGGKGDHHIVPLPTPLVQPKADDVYRKPPPPREAEVTFDPTSSVCSLRIDGAVIPPTREPDVAAPVSAAAQALSAPRRFLGMGSVRLGLIGGVALLVLGIGAGPATYHGLQNRSARAKIADASAERKLTETATATDYSIAAHFPEDFESTVDDQGAVISLHRPKKLEMIVLISSPRPDMEDPIDLDKVMMKDLAAFATKTDAKMSTTITVAGTCQGFPGAVSTSTLSKPDDPRDLPSKIVGCSMLRNGRGYFFAYFVPEFLAEKEEPELLKIINATDIYELPAPSAARTFPSNNNYGSNNGDGEQWEPPSTTRFQAQGAFAQQGAFPKDWRATATGTVTVTGQNAPNGRSPSFRPSTPQPRSFSVAHANAPPTPAPTLQFNANGSVEYAGPARNKAPSSNSQANRQKVPW